MKALIAAAVAALGLLTGCSEDIKSCGVQGDTQTCVCSNGAAGAQTCSPDGIWGSCNCTGGASSTSSDGVGIGSSDGDGSGDGDGIGSVGGTDDDSGVASGDGDADGSGVAGTDGDGSGGQTTTSYAACSSEGDCSAGETCVNQCTRACTSNAECPNLAGDHAATPECSGELCVLRCQQGAGQGSCPQGMTCALEVPFFLVGPAICLP